MKLTWILLAATVAVASSGPIAPDAKLSEMVEAYSLGGHRSSRILTGLLQDLLETLRMTVLQGSGSIPPLDPLLIDNVFLDDNILPLPGAVLALGDVSVLNLATFEVDNIDVTMTSLLLQRYRILLDIRIPTLEASAGQYEVSVSALGYNIYGAGSLRLKVIDPKISTNLLVGLRLSGSGIFLNLLECNIRFSLRDFQPQITGLFGDQLASNFVNLFLQDLVPSAVVAYEREITQFLSTTVHEIANEILADLDLGSILG